MKDEIRQYLLTHRATRDAPDFTDDESLLDAGVIDSGTMVDLLAHIEGRYGITVDEDDLVPENFDSVDSIAAYLKRRRGEHD